MAVGVLLAVWLGTIGIIVGVISVVARIRCHGERQEVKRQ